MNTPYAGQDHEEDSEDVEMEDVEDIQENQETEIPSTPPARSAFQVQMTSPEAETDENAAPAPTSPERSEVDLRNLMPLTPKPRTGRNSLRRNLLLHSSQKVMEAQMMQRARMMQSSYSARGAQLIAPTPVRLVGGTPYKTALPSPGMTNYASSESDEEERDDPLIFEDASDHFDEDEDYEDVSGAYETDAEELKGEEEDDDEDEQEQEGDQAAPQVSLRCRFSSRQQAYQCIIRLLNDRRTLMSALIRKVLTLRHSRLRSVALSIRKSPRLAIRLTRTSTEVSISIPMMIRAMILNKKWQLHKRMTAIWNPVLQPMRTSTAATPMRQSPRQPLNHKLQPT